MKGVSKAMEDLLLGFLSAKRLRVDSFTMRLFCRWHGGGLKKDRQRVRSDTAFALERRRLLVRDQETWKGWDFVLTDLGRDVLQEIAARRGVL